MTLEEQRAHYKAVRARIAGATVRPPAPPPEPEPLPEPEPATPAPRPPRRTVYAPVSAATRASLQHILTAYGVSWDDVLAPVRRHDLTAPRAAVYWALHCAGFSLSHIGAITRRDHTTILYALNKVNSWTPKASSTRQRRLSRTAASTTAASKAISSAPPPSPA